MARTPVKPTPRPGPKSADREARGPETPDARVEPDAGKPARVELRLDRATRLKLMIAVETSGLSVHEFVAACLAPHLDFDLPEIPSQPRKGHPSPVDEFNQKLKRARETANQSA